MEIDLIKAQQLLKARLVAEIPMAVEMITSGKAPSLTQIWENAQAFGSAFIAEHVTAYGAGVAHNLCRNAMADADVTLGDSTPSVASYSAALLAILRYRPERTD